MLEKCSQERVGGPLLGERSNLALVIGRRTVGSGWATFWAPYRVFRSMINRDSGSGSGAAYSSTHGQCPF